MVRTNESGEHQENNEMGTIDTLGLPIAFFLVIWTSYITS